MTLAHDSLYRCIFMKAYFKYLLVGLFCLSFTHSFGQDTTMVEETTLDSLTTQYVATMKLFLEGNDFDKFKWKLLKLRNAFAKNPSGEEGLEQAYRILENTLPPEKYEHVLKTKKLLDLQSSTESEMSKEDLIKVIKEKSLEIDEERSAKRKRVIMIFASLLLIGIIAFLVLRRRK